MQNAIYLYDTYKYKTTKENLSNAIENVFINKSKEYKDNYPNNTPTFQWPLGFTEWLIYTRSFTKVKGIFICSSSYRGIDTISLCLPNNHKECTIWTIGEDASWIWKRNKNYDVDFNKWFNDNQKSILEIDKFINTKSFTTLLLAQKGYNNLQGEII